MNILRIPLLYINRDLKMYVYSVCKRYFPCKIIAHMYVTNILNTTLLNMNRELKMHVYCVCKRYFPRTITFNA